MIHVINHFFLIHSELKLLIRVLFIQNISPFLAGLKPPANSSKSTGIYHIQKMEQYTIKSMVYCLGYVIDQRCFQARSPSCLFLSELKKKMAFTAKKLNFEQKLNGRNARIRKTYHSMNVIHLLRNICKEASVYILKACKRNTQKL